jgi:flagellar motor switch protein FliN/FliY
MSDALPTPAVLHEALAREMAGAVAALLGETTRLSTTAAPAEPAFVARLDATGALTGAVCVGVSDQDARHLAALIMGFDAGSEIADDAIVDALREICAQAVGALSQAPETAAVRLTVASVERAAWAGAVAGAWRFALPADAAPTLVVGGDLAAGSAATAGPVPAPAAPGPGATAPVLSSAGSNLDLLLDIELPLSVRFGQTELTVQHLTRLGPGSVIDLHRSADEPVDVLVSGKVIARGEVVVVDGNYGVRVTEVISTAERIRSLGA